ncbi:hypothetical protein H1C71_041288 [Ictidomys tridecemlineatus]|nr:hypothetical protein H1C71_041288 [Ictidomys tridecemlineatus]
MEEESSLSGLGGARIPGTVVGIRGLSGKLVSQGARGWRWWCPKNSGTKAGLFGSEVRSGFQDSSKDKGSLRGGEGQLWETGGFPLTQEGSLAPFPGLQMAGSPGRWT